MGKFFQRTVSIPRHLMLVYLLFASTRSFCAETQSNSDTCDMVVLCIVTFTSQMCDSWKRGFRLPGTRCGCPLRDAWRGMAALKAAAQTWQPAAALQSPAAQSRLLHRRRPGTKVRGFGLMQHSYNIYINATHTDCSLTRKMHQLQV